MLAANVKQSVASVRPSACLFQFYLSNRLTFELEFVCVWGGVMIIARLELEVKVIGQDRGLQLG